MFMMVTYIKVYRTINALSMLSLQNIFGMVRDTRNPQGLRYPLPAVLSMVVMGIMSGKNGYRELVAFMDANESEFVELYGLKHGVPKYTGFRDFMEGIDFEQLSIAFYYWTCQYIKLEYGEWIAIDGKALGSTVSDCHGKNQNFKAMVSTFTHKLGLVLNTGLYENKKGNEIQVAVELIIELEKKDLVFTMDALHCQRGTSRIIIENGHDYMLEVKGNQKNLHKQLINNTSQSEAIDVYETYEKNRGRKEHRKAELYDNIDGISPDWIGVKRIAKITRWGKREKNKNYHEEHYYILSMNINDAARVLEGSRKHWGIENRLHYVKDVGQNEDNSGIRGGSAIESLSILKNIAINIYRKNGWQSLKGAITHFSNKILKLDSLINSS